MCGFCAKKKKICSNSFFLQQKRGGQIILLGYTFTEKFSYSYQIQMTVFG